MRTSKHGRSAHGDSDFREGQAFESQIRAPAPASLHPSCRNRPPDPPTNQSSTVLHAVHFPYRQNHYR